MDKFRWCFIGTGKLAHQVAGKILASGRHEIAAVYTRRPEACREFAAKFGGTAYVSAEEAVRDARVDGVYIVTPHNSHYKYAAIALRAGKPVLCEKAFTISAARTDELIALARERQVYLCEAMWTWFGRPANQVKQWVQSGSIGQVRHARMTYCAGPIHYAPRVSDPRLGGGALLDIGVYPIAYLYRLFGYPSEIVCKGELKNGIDIGEEISFTFSGGITADVRASIRDFKGLEKMCIEGSRGSICASFYHSSRWVQLVQGFFRRTVFRGVMGYVCEFDTVAAEIREGLTESRMVPLQATSDVMHIMDECRRQMGLIYDCEES